MDMASLTFLGPLWMWGHLMLFGLTLSLAFSGFMVHAGLGDEPVARSNHTQTTPTGGGIGVLAALGGVSIAVVKFYPDLAPAPEIIPILGLSALTALIGLGDDALTWPAALKFGALGVISLLAVIIIGPITTLPISMSPLSLSLPLPVGVLGTALWIFVVMNAVNFIDGANGFMPVAMIIASTALGLISILMSAPIAALLSLIIVSGLLGLLPYNAKAKAHIFSGDIGALLIGFLFAVASLKLAQTETALSLLYVGPLLIMPFLTDVFLTLVRRLRHKQNLLNAHRDHLYQLIILSGRSHLFVTGLYSLMGCVAVAIMVLGVKTGLIASIFYLMTAVSLMSFFYVLALSHLQKKTT